MKNLRVLLGLILLGFLSTAHAAPVKFELKAAITAESGNPFGLSIGDMIEMSGIYDRDDLFDTTRADCPDVARCAINFGAGQGSGWQLRVGSAVLGADNDDSGDFPGLVFDNGSLIQLEFNFVAGVNGSPMDLDIGFACGFFTGGCDFTGSDAAGSTFEGTFDITTFSETPVLVPVSEPGTSLLVAIGIGAAGLGRRKLQRRSILARTWD